MSQQPVTSQSDSTSPASAGTAGYAAIKRAIIQHLYQAMRPVHRDMIVVTAAAQTGAAYHDVQLVINRLARHGVIKWRASGYVAVRPTA